MTYWYENGEKEQKGHWKDNEQDTIAGYVNDIAEEMQDYLNDFYDILSKKVFNSYFILNLSKKNLIYFF